MAEYNDKVVEAFVTAPDPVVVTSGGGTIFNGIETQDTVSTSLVGDGTTSSPLQAQVKLSRRAGNALQIIQTDTEQGLYATGGDVKVSSSNGNLATLITAQQAAAQGDSTLEGIKVDPVHVTTSVQGGGLAISQDPASTSKTRISVVVAPTDDNALVVDNQGLSVKISPIMDNNIQIREGALYVPPSDATVSPDSNNRLELRSNGLFVETIKGDQGEQGEQGPAGPQGEAGPIGPEGPQGPQGLQGQQGERGEAGPDGAQGLQGAIGARGPEGPRGATGLGINVLDTLASETQLPSVVDLEAGDTYVIGQDFFTVVVEAGVKQWKNIGNFSGPEGQSAFEVAETAGFVGTVDDWLSSLRGADGIGLQLLGSFRNVSDLPEEGNRSGDAYIIQEVMYVWTGDIDRWQPVGQIGPEGRSAYQVWLANGNTGSQVDFLNSIKGEKGDTGDQGPQGLPGVDGKNANAINILGSVEDVPNLPEGADAGDAYLIGTMVYVSDGNGNWENLGSFQGPQGLTGATGPTGPAGPAGPQGAAGLDNYALAVSNGFEGSLTDYLASQKGAKGDVGATGPRGLVGPQGEQGPVGAGLNILGSVSQESDLPTGGITEGDAYLIEGNLYVYTNGNWTNVGEIKGPKGDKGDTGPVGQQGPQGTQGPQGLTGATGPQGATGPAGPQGETGDVGPQGEIGPQGIQGEKGDVGSGLIARGIVENVSDLPTNAVSGDFYTVSSEGVGYAWNGAAWISTGITRGEQGVQGLTGPQGPIGPQGEKGENGNALILRGTVESQSNLPSTAEVGDFYVANDTGIGYSWDGSRFVEAGTVRGPQGEQGAQGETGPAGPQGEQGAQGIQGAVGPAGETGAQGSQGPQGEIGHGLIPRGTVTSQANLPAVGEIGDFYTINDTGEGYAWDGSAFINVGTVRGPIGLTGATGATGPQGMTGATGAVGPVGLTGAQGEQGIQGERGEIGPQGEQGLQGEQGPQGDIGPGVEIIGRFDNSSELPSTGSIGQGYLIQGDFWGWTGTQYENLGRIQGPVGPVGPTGNQGPIGPVGTKGDKGDQGTLWIVFGREPMVSDGRVNDFFLNSSTLEYFRKTSATNWASLGYLGGGNVYDAPSDGVSYVRRDQAWEEITYPVNEAPQNSNSYVRSNGQWSELVIPVQEAPLEGGFYVRENGQWVKLDKYDLRVIASTGVVDASQANSWTLDGTTSKALVINNLPEGRAMTLVLRFLGNGGNITWDSKIGWSNGTAPVLGVTRTILTLYWDGEFLTGTQAMTIG